MLLCIGTWLIANVVYLPVAPAEWPIPETSRTEMRLQMQLKVLRNCRQQLALSIWITMDPSAKCYLRIEQMRSSSIKAMQHTMRNRVLWNRAT